MVGNSATADTQEPATTAIKDTATTAPHKKEPQVPPHPELKIGKRGISQIVIGESPFPQPAFKKLFLARERYLIVYGGAAAGKSYAAAQKVIFKALKYPGSRIIVIRKYGPSLRLTAFKMLADIVEWAHLSQFVAVRTYDMSLHFVNGSTVQCIPIVNTQGESADRIKSLTDVTDMWFEEVTELRQDEFEAILLRFRGQPLENGYRQIIMTFNPINAHHWINHYFFMGEGHMDASDIAHQKYTYLDNDFLDEQYKRYLQSIKDENMRKIYVLGEWGMLENQIYETYNADTGAGYIQEDFTHPYDYYDEIIAGVDFGYVNPAAAVLIGLKTEAEQKKLYIIDEVYIHSALNDELIASVFAMFEKNLPEKYWKEIPVYADNAEPMRVEEMRQQGLNMFEAKKDILDGINACRQFKINISPKCDNFFKEIIAYVRKKDAEGNAIELPDKRRGFDHLMDAMRYAVYTWYMEYEPPIPMVAPIAVGQYGGHWNSGGSKSGFAAHVKRSHWEVNFPH